MQAVNFKFKYRIKVGPTVYKEALDNFTLE
jgi:hypothetical protein